MGLDEHTAEDIVQDVVLRSVEKPPLAGNLRAWMHVVAVRLVFRLRRSRRHRMAREQGAARGLLVEPGREEFEDPVLVRWVEDLPSPYREVVELRYLQECGIAEIAELLGRPQTTVRSQLKRGLDRLRLRLGKEERGRSSVWSGCLLFLRRMRGRLRSLASSARMITGLAGCVVLVAWLAWRPGPPARARASGGEPGVAVSGTVDLTVLPEDSSRAPVQVLQAPERGTDAADARRLAGRVLDPAGKPVAGAEVHVARPDGSCAKGVTRTDSEGRYECRLSAEDQLVWASSGEWCNSRRRFIGSVRDLDACDLSLGEKAGVLLVTVVSATGEVVEGARVSVVGDPRGEGGTWFHSVHGYLEFAPEMIRGVTDRAGCVRLPAPPAEVLELMVSSAEHPVWSGEVDRARADGGVTIVLDRPAGIRGRVVDASGSAVLDGSIEALQRNEVVRRTRSAADGSFAIEGLSPGTVLVRAWEEVSGTWASAIFEVRVEAGRHTTVALELDGSHTVLGRAQNVPSGSSIRMIPYGSTNAAVDVRTVEIGADGSFALPACKSGGEYRLDLHLPGVAMPVATIEHAVPGVEEYVFAPGPEARERHSAIIEFVRGGSSRTPLAAELRRVQGTVLAPVDPRGLRAVFDDVPSIGYELFVWIPGVGSWKPEGVDVGHGDGRFVVALPQTARAVFEVSAPGDQGREDVQAWLMAPGFGIHAFGNLAKPRLRRELLRSGQNLFETELLPGNYEYTFQSRDLEARGALEVGEGGAEVHVRIVLKAGLDALVGWTSPRRLHAKESVLLEIRTADGATSVLGRSRSGDPVRMRIPLDALELRASSDRGLAGSLLLPPRAPAETDELPFLEVELGQQE